MECITFFIFMKMFFGTDNIPHEYSLIVRLNVRNIIQYSCGILLALENIFMDLNNVM